MTEDEIREMKQENKRLKAALATELYYRTLGGRPPTPDSEWSSQPVGPPPSASDPDAPAHRRVGMARSNGKVA